MRININGLIWSVKVVSKGNKALKRHNGSAAFGATDRKTQTIYLSKSLGKNMYKVLCHELTHAYIYSYQVYMSERTEEFVVDFIATYGKQIVDMTYKLIPYIV